MTDYQERRRGRLSGMTERRLALVAREDPERADDAARKRRCKSGRARQRPLRRIRHVDHPQHRDRAAAGRSTATSPIAASSPISPRRSCVEVPCLVDRNGVQPTQIGTLPPQLAALMQTNINVQELTVEAALTGKTRARLPGRHARSPHGRRALPGPDRRHGGRVARSPRRHDSAAGLASREVEESRSREEARRRRRANQRQP